MDIDEDFWIPILIGRPFLDTSGAIIDVKRGRLTFEVGDERIEFILSRLKKNPSLRYSCCLVDINDAYVKESSLESLMANGLEAFLIGSTDTDNKNTEVAIYKKTLDEIPTSVDQSFEILLTQSDKPEQQKLKVEQK